MIAERQCQGVYLSPEAIDLIPDTFKQRVEKNLEAARLRACMTIAEREIARREVELEVKVKRLQQRAKYSRRAMERRRERAEEARQLGAIEHGTINSYTNLLCRCDLCRAAKAEDERKRRARKGAKRSATHCIRGHLRTEENTRIDKRGFRCCRACAREDAKRSRTRAKVAA